MWFSDYENKIDRRRCPSCGVVHPIDWFTADDAPCWKCKSRVPVKKTSADASFKAEVEQIRQGLAEDDL
ncbi:hypothetical protein [Adlercreutzia sp. ZJ141]|uniref:hypothetical protein n=1 Tax=Adlercreutzia sp. ZJ141 TaxID=2709406 RepID=UPI0013EC2966|nr:hypothetical protein [Adlercreutzia sp. ZJ141]